MIGPRVDLQDVSTTLQWDVPTPYEGDTAKMQVSTNNLGGNGAVSFALQELVDGGFWATVSTVDLQATAGEPLVASLPVVADRAAGSSIDYRVVVLVDGVEMDRHTVDSLLIKEETVRDGEALTQQLSTDVFSVALFVIALASVSFGLYAMVLRRRMLAPESEEELADQTEVVAEEMASGKAVPQIAQPPAPSAAVPPAPASVVPPPPSRGPDRTKPAPLPPTGLPDGWTQDQWNSYGWQYIDALSKQ